jgi:tetratricopeptide (TPR) repeat protein
MLLLPVMLSVLGLSQPFLLAAQEDSGLFERACDAYSREDYADASELFLELARNGSPDSAVYFNLGNTFYRMNEPAKAVLWYNRALRLSPGDPDILTNLRIAREDLGLITPEEERDMASRSNPWTLTRDWILRHRLSSWRNLALAGYWFTSLLLLAFLWRPKSRSFPVWPIWCAAGWTLCCSLAWMISASELLGHPKAVVLSFNPPARYAPLSDASVRYELKTGEKVEIVDQLNGWYKIRKAGSDEEAFIPKTDAEPVSMEW